MVNDRITATFPSATAYRLAGDEFAGATRLDQSATATGTGPTFSSGIALATSGNEIAFGAVSVPTGDGGPRLGDRLAGPRGRRGRHPATSDGPTSSRPRASYTATGTASGPWLAAVSTFGR